MLYGVYLSFLNRNIIMRRSAGEKRLLKTFRYKMYLNFDVNVLNSTLFPVECRMTKDKNQKLGQMKELDRILYDVSIEEKSPLVSCPYNN